MGSTQLGTQRTKRQERTRGGVFGKTDRPRLTVFRSNKHLYAQIIDDSLKTTIVSISEKEIEKSEKQAKVATAKTLGIHLAKKASEKKIKTVVFDKGRYTYHGRVQAFADGAREGGLQF